jgi:crotonobetainyl-CoA:carnitine CoA-transferase CaiB-like acyl-CoA transferase
VLLALNHRHVTGEGQALDVTLFDSALALMHPQSANFLMSGKTPQQIGNAHPNISPYDSFKTGTKPIFLAVGNDRQFKKMCELMGAPHLGSDPRFTDNAKRVVNRAALRAELETLFLNHDGDRLADHLIKNGVPAGAVVSVKEALESPQSRHRGMVVEDGAYKGVGIPIKMSKSRPGVRHGVRRFNQDGDQVLREAGFNDGEIAKLREAGVMVDSRRKGGAE